LLPSVQSAVAGLEPFCAHLFGPRWFGDSLCSLSQPSLQSALRLPCFGLPRPFGGRCGVAEVFPDRQGSSWLLIRACNSKIFTARLLLPQNSSMALEHPAMAARKRSKWSCRRVVAKRLIEIHTNSKIFFFRNSVHFHTISITKLNKRQQASCYSQTPLSPSPPLH
jgi:hypothetical protein